MKKISRSINNSDVNRFRRLVQIILFALFIYGGWLAVDISTYMPTFSCPFVESRGGTCYLFPLQHQINISFPQILSRRGIGLATGFIIFVLLFLPFNKSWCGFACPLGTVQDWISRVRTRLGIRYSQYARATSGRLGWIKYTLLALLLILPLSMSNSWFGLPLLSHDFATPYCMVCPGRTVLPLFSADASQLTVDFSSTPKMVLSTLGMAVTGLFFVGAFVKKRFFCLFCPMSALLYLLSKIGFLRLNKLGENCTRCGNCLRACDMGIHGIADDINHKNMITDDCMMCFKCVSACPEDDCLSVDLFKLPLYKSTTQGYFTRMEKRSAHDR